MTDSCRPSISVVINAYNYEQFLAEAIDSAVQQGPDVEVVVVDDGSTDDTRSLRDRYEPRVKWIEKPNGGQGSAFNVGIAESSGSIIAMLDADDRLVPGACERIQVAADQNPDAVGFLHRLRTVDGRGEPLRETIPRRRSPLPSGDLYPSMISHPDDIAWQPTSGTAYRRVALNGVLPVPEAEFRVCADVYLANTVALFGTMVAIDEIGADYRIHGANAHFRADFDVDRARSIVARTRVTHAAIRRLVAEHDPALAHGLVLRSVSDVANRLLVHRLSATPAVAGDTRSGLVMSGLRAASGRDDCSPFRRLAIGGWFVATGLGPKFVARRLARLALTR